jgi:hypothetical protein
MKNAISTPRAVAEGLRLIAGIQRESIRDPRFRESQLPIALFSS